MSISSLILNSPFLFISKTIAFSPFVCAFSNTPTEDFLLLDGPILIDVLKWKSLTKSLTDDNIAYSVSELFLLIK